MCVCVCVCVSECECAMVQLVEGWDPKQSASMPLRFMKEVRVKGQCEGLRLGPG